MSARRGWTPMISGVPKAEAIRGLYAVTPDTNDDSRLRDLVEAALRGDTRLVQYRNKAADRGTRERQAGMLVTLCASYGARLIVNDDVSVAAATGAHGVHVGRDDGGAANARRILGATAIIGVSCYNEPNRATEAAAAGADYIAFGSFFASSVKPDAVRASPALIGPARLSTGLPVVGIGGITLQNAPELVAAGIDAVAVISALWNAPDIERTSREFCALFVRKS